ncbi:hypothetical protein HaLaN_16667, partial [Haematococcus lacustris]
MEVVLETLTAIC